MEKKIEEQTTDAETSLNTTNGSVDQEEDFTEEEIKKAEEFKTEGNQAFKDGKFEQALDLYSEAIFCKVPKKQKAIYYCNRALVNMKLENYAVAMFDAKDSIQCDETFAKGYFRRGSAYVALGQLDLAVKDFKKVCVLQPTNKDAREKYLLTQKEHKAREFAKCIEKDDIRVKVNVEDLVVEASYNGPKLESIEDLTSDWIVEMMGFMKEGKVLHKKYAYMIIVKCREIYEKESTLVNIRVPENKEITVCGDIHGQFYDLLNIFSINGKPSQENPYLFNGDFIDRGSFSVEVIMTMFAWKALLPKHFFMARGNHESKNLNKMYGFEGEVKHKYDVKTYDLFSEVFCYLPIAHCINSKIFIIHGGLFAKDGIKLEDIAKVNRVREPPDEGIMCECMWSDPCDQDGRHPSKRGVGVQFGPDVAQRFLDENNLKLVVRSHEVKQEGYEYQKGGKVLTIFSAPNYCDQMGNKGAFVRFNGKDLEPKITSFEKVEHPKIPPMAYAQQWNMF